jgi:hypothetical protein
MPYSRSRLYTRLVTAGIVAIAASSIIVLVASPRTWDLLPGAWLPHGQAATPTPGSGDMLAPTQGGEPSLAATGEGVPAPIRQAGETPLLEAAPALAPDVRAIGIVTVAEGVNTARVRDKPNGPTPVAAVPAGTVVEVLFGQVSVDGVDWLQVRLASGQVGWMAEFLLTLTRERPGPAP